MNTALARRRRFAVGGATLVLAAAAGSPWILCSETWAREVQVQCQGESLPAPVKVRSLRESAPPLAPFIV